MLGGKFVIMKDRLDRKTKSIRGDVCTIYVGADIEILSEEEETKNPYPLQRWITE